MASKAIEERAAEAISDLEGTCKSMNEVVSDEDADNEEFCRILDEAIFCCTQCGWWQPISEQVESEGEIICTDCQGENE